MSYHFNRYNKYAINVDRVAAYKILTALTNTQISFEAAKVNQNNIVEKGEIKDWLLSLIEE